MPSLGQWAAPPAPEPGEPEEARPGPAATTPSIARMHNYYLGGKDNYAADREAADDALLKAPAMSRLAQAGRAFLEHAAGRLAAADGLRQFVDIGCGLPVPSGRTCDGAGDVTDPWTEPGTDDGTIYGTGLRASGRCTGGIADVVRRADPSCRVAYVDNDPMVVCHARALLAVDAGTRAVDADLREPAALLAHPELRQLIDLGRPVGVLLGGVLQFLTDGEDPRGIVAALANGLPPGSRIVLTHAVRTPEMEAVSALHDDAGVPFTPRGRDEIAALCGDLHIDAGHPVNLPVAEGADGAGPLPLVGCVARKAE